MRVSPKAESKPTGTPVAFIEIPPSGGNTQQGVTGENEGIREYLLMLNIGRTVEQMLRADGLLKS